MMDKKSFNSETLFKASFYLGLLGNIIFFVLVSLSHYYAIINGYDWRTWELSELVLYGIEGKIFFMLSTIIDGLLLFFPIITLSYYFKDKTQKVFYFIIAIGAELTLIGLGAIPEDITFIGHYVISVIFFVFIAFLILYTAIYFILKFKRKLIFYSIMGFVVFVFFVFYVVTREMFGMAYTQRIAVLLAIIYLMTISGRLLLKFDLIHHEKMTLEQ